MCAILKCYKVAHSSVQCGEISIRGGKLPVLSFESWLISNVLSCQLALWSFHKI
jgi:hypothetical protein